MEPRNWLAASSEFALLHKRELEVLDREMTVANHVLSAMKHFDPIDEPIHQKIEVIFSNTLFSLTADPHLWKCYTEYLEVLEPSTWLTNSSRTYKQNFVKMGELFKLYLTLSGISTNVYKEEDWLGFALWSVVLKRDATIHQKIALSMEELSHRITDES